jgi:hypothetical protein
MDVVFGDVIKAACDDGSRRGRSNLEATCRKLRIGTAEGYVVS